MTASDVHKKLQEISSNYISGTPPLHLKTLAEELNIDFSILQEHINALVVLGLVMYQDSNNEVVSITESGKLANLPS